MNMTNYDPMEVSRFSARPGNHAAIVRFAIHVAGRCSTHVWPHMVFAKFAACSEERLYHLSAAVRAGTEQLDAEEAGVDVRRRDAFEAKLFRMALYAHAHESAGLGFPGDAARAVDMAAGMGVFPSQALEMVFTNRM